MYLYILLLNVLYNMYLYVSKRTIFPIGVAGK